jgi:hypothetical protein
MSPRENSVKQLSEFYNVVTGIALALAITKLIDTSGTAFPLKIDNLLNFGSFLVIIIPFHQGAVRHLFATYVENTKASRSALAIDFFLLFLNACVFVALAALIENTELFVYTLGGLLLIDSIWGFIIYIILKTPPSKSGSKSKKKAVDEETPPQIIWAMTNLVAVAAISITVILGIPILKSWDLGIQAIIFLICAGRTLYDYAKCWRIYFPLDTD